MAFILLVRRRLPSATLFPYTTLFRSQQQAVRHGPSPLLIIAGAGTGKTLTLAHRVAHLIESGVPPERVLLLTLDRKSTRLNSSHSQSSYAVFCLKKKRTAVHPGRCGG